MFGIQVKVLDAAHPTVDLFRFSAVYLFEGNKR